MKTKTCFIVILITLLPCLTSLAQDAETGKTELSEIPFEKKHEFSSWRSDYYICTGIAYAKSLGKSAEDFAEFVGDQHMITYPDNPTLAGVARTGHLVFTSYPKGEYSIIKQTDSVLVAKSNRPYKEYFSEGPVLAVSLDEFEDYLWRHIVIMGKKINIDIQYEINGDEVIQTYSYVN